MFPLKTRVEIDCDQARPFHTAEYCCQRVAAQHILQTTPLAGRMRCMSCLICSTRSCDGASYRNHEDSAGTIAASCSNFTLIDANFGHRLAIFGSSIFFSSGIGGRVAVLLQRLRLQRLRLQRLLLLLLLPAASAQSCAYTASSGQTMPFSAALYEPTKGVPSFRPIIIYSTPDNPDVPTPLSRTRCLLPTLYAPCSSALHMLTSPENEPRAWAGRQVLFHLQHRVVQWGQLLFV